MGCWQGQTESRKTRCPICLTQLAILDHKRIILEDLEHSDDERRYYCLGLVAGGIMTVRFTYRKEIIRIIGAGYWRKGRKIYERENKIHRWAHRKSQSHIRLPAFSRGTSLEGTVKVTIALSRSSVEFFKKEAKRYNTQYQKMIRRLLDEYAAHQS